MADRGPCMARRRVPNREDGDVNEVVKSLVESSSKAAKDFHIDEDGYLICNPLSPYANLRLLFQHLLAPTREDISRYIAAHRQPNAAPTPTDARIEIEKAREEEVLNLTAHAISLLRGEVGKLEPELRKLERQVVVRTVKELRSQISSIPCDELEGRVEAAKLRSEQWDRWRGDLPNLGARKGSKKSRVSLSKQEIYTKLARFIRTANRNETVPTQKNAAAHLGLGSAKSLDRRLKSHGEKRHWKDLVVDVLSGKI
jgi:hypothetical protein